MIDAIVAGTVLTAAESKVSQGGKPFARLRMKAATSSGESLLIGVVAFDRRNIDKLAALEVGDALSVAGQLKPTAWIKDGQAVAGADIVVQGLLSAYHVRRKRDAMSNDPPKPASSRQHAFDPDSSDLESDPL